MNQFDYKPEMLNLHHILEPVILRRGLKSHPRVFSFKLTFIKSKISYQNCPYIQKSAEMTNVFLWCCRLVSVFHYDYFVMCTTIHRNPQQLLVLRQNLEQSIMIRVGNYTLGMSNFLQETELKWMLRSYEAHTQTNIHRHIRASNLNPAYMNGFFRRIKKQLLYQFIKLPINKLFILIGSKFPCIHLTFQNKPISAVHENLISLHCLKPGLRSIISVADGGW